MDPWVGSPPSVQQLAVLDLLVTGLSNDEIGMRMHISEETVKKHVSALLRKFSAANRAELAAKAVALGILKLTPEQHPEEPP